MLQRVASDERITIIRCMVTRGNIWIRRGNSNDQTPIWLAVKRRNMAALRLLYAMGESLRGEAYRSPKRVLKSKWPGKWAIVRLQMRSLWRLRVRRRMGNNQPRTSLPMSLP